MRAHPDPGSDEHVTPFNHAHRRADVDFYRISLVGRLPDDLFDVFSPMLVKTIAGHTVLLGPVEDQSALQGLLSRIQSLGLELDELKRVRSTRGRGRPRPIAD
jgi:hypothetical protein